MPVSREPELPSAPQAKRYRGFAEDARRSAADADNGEVREDYCDIARQWDKLAADIEARFKSRVRFLF